MKKIYELHFIYFFFTQFFQDDKYGGEVVEKYKTKGILEDGKSYFILSRNIEMTMKVMGCLNNLII